MDRRRGRREGRLAVTVGKNTEYTFKMFMKLKKMRNSKKGTKMKTLEK